MYFLCTLFITAAAFYATTSALPTERVSHERSKRGFMEVSQCELCAAYLEADPDELCESRLPYNDRCELDLAEDDIAGIGENNMQNYVNNVNKFMESPPCSEDDPSCAGRAATRDPYALWPNNIVPYQISEKYTEKQRQLIMDAFHAIQSKTCIKFKERDSETSFIKIGNYGGCWSYVGRQPVFAQPQRISLGTGCFASGTILHELMHSLGFFHEQSRNDRDKYVKVIYSNILPGKEDNFQKYDLKVITHLGTEYDYKSVLHYRSNSFSSNGRDTIMPIKDGDFTNDVTIGQRDRLSKTDIVKVNRLYSCPEVGKEPSNCVDRLPWCNMWADAKFCDKSSYIQSNCLKSCKYCRQ